MAQDDHYSVLLEEAVQALITDADGFYVDGTFGRGGHSAQILADLSAGGQLLAFDKDPEAVTHAKDLFGEDHRFDIAHRSFADLAEQIASMGKTGQVSGVLLDLGVSSPQLDEAGRGFSFKNDGPLDMRMNSAAGTTAAHWINTAAEDDIAWVLKTYGEERFAKRIARAIVTRREQTTFSTTLDLAKVVSEANPAWEKNKHPATRAFQAIRIHVNNELDDLQTVLDQALEVLALGGRLVVISFHSLEDRMVKQFIRRQEKGAQLPRGLPITDDQIVRRLKSVSKAVKANAVELEANIRSRSAVMRVAEKIK